jgi:hypothetical protein
MTRGRSRAVQNRKPTLGADLSLDEFRAHYWTLSELAGFARRLGLPARGPKPELVKRLERRLRGLPNAPDQRQKLAKGPRDSDTPLHRSTSVIRYKSDEKTRAFFTSQIGPHFHFTYQLNQYRLARTDLTYGDLADEWVAEHERRRNADYKAPIASQGEYNRYVRAFFADKRNRGKSLRDAAASWNSAKRIRGDRRYSAQATRR